MNSDKICLVLAILAGLALSATAKAVESVGTLPAPTLTSVRAAASATYDTASELYTYSYAVSNGAGSTGAIMDANVDVATKYPAGGWYNGNGIPGGLTDQLTIPLGGETDSFTQVKKDAEPLLLPPGRGLVPFGIAIPTGWTGALSRDGYAAFWASDNTHMVAPGAHLTGLKLVSPGVPVIREMIVEPYWVPVFNGEPDKSVAAKAGQVERAIRVHLHTLGPAGTAALSWSAFESEVAEAAKLGWIPDANLAQQIQAQLDAANATAVQQRDGTAAKQKLRDLIQIVAGASPDAIRTEARDLIRLNAEALIRVVPDTPIPVTPEYTLTPPESSHAVGATAILTAMVVNSSDHDKPLPGYPVRFAIFQGPDQSQFLPGARYTDSSGKAQFSFKGLGLGTDVVILSTTPPSIVARGPTQPASVTGDGLPPYAVAEALVHWESGADLAVPLFMPPVIKAQGGDTIDLTDWTQNLGDRPAGPSDTRYYLAQDSPVDPSKATVLADRAVPALDPGEQSRGQGIQALLPATLPAGVYHLVACADAADQVIETDETNNCSDSRLKNIVSVVVPVSRPPNLPPDCGGAAPGERLLWPPNHKLHSVAIDGVTDPDGDTVTLTVTGIEQDEPVNGKGDGNTAPDGFGLGTAQAQVRAERSGRGPGRLYFVHFRADDGKGGTCNGTVTLGVPHDQSAKGLPVDTGERYDSTQS